jgi:hypothetical protein
MMQDSNSSDEWGWTSSELEARANAIRAQAEARPIIESLKSPAQKREELRVLQDIELMKKRKHDAERGLEDDEPGEPDLNAVSWQERQELDSRQKDEIG